MNATGNDVLSALVLFIRQYPRLGLAQWPVPQLAGYLNHLGGQDALRFTTGPGPLGPEVTGLLLAWRLPAKALEHPEFLTATYRFARQVPEGGVFYVEFLAGYPGATAQLLADAQYRHPDWRRLQMAAIRRGKLVRYPNLERFCSRLENL